MDDGKTIGGRIRDQRTAKGLSINKLYKHVSELTTERGSSFGTVRDYDAGIVKNPRKEILRAIAKALEINEDWLLTGEGSPDRVDAALADADEMSEPVGLGSEVFDQIFEMTLSVCHDYGEYVAPLEARRVLLPLVARVYADFGPAAFPRDGDDPRGHFAHEWRGWETQEEHLGTEPGINKQDIKMLFEREMGLGMVLDMGPNLSYGERVAAWLSALATVYIQRFGSGRQDTP